MQQSMSLPERDLTGCGCGSCPTFYNVSNLSPAMSACSSTQGDISPCPMWSPTISPLGVDLQQQSFDEICLATPPTSMVTTTSSGFRSSLEHVNLHYCQHGMGTRAIGDMNGPPRSSSSSSDGPFATFEPIGTIASRNEVSQALEYFGETSSRQMLIPYPTEKEGPEPGGAESISGSAAAGSDRSQRQDALAPGRAGGRGGQERPFRTALQEP